MMRVDDAYLEAKLAEGERNGFAPFITLETFRAIIKELQALRFRMEGLQK